MDIAAFYQFSFGSIFVRHVRRLLTLHHNGSVPETQNRGLRRAKARVVSREIKRDARAPPHNRASRGAEHLAARSRLGCEQWASGTGPPRSARPGRTDMLNA